MQVEPGTASARRRGGRPRAAAARPAAEVVVDPDRMGRKAKLAAAFLRAIANEHRLLILCHLHRGETSVTELEERLGLRQAHLSQHLARLRGDGLVRARRESRSVHYSLGSREARLLVERLYELFCKA